MRFNITGRERQITVMPKNRNAAPTISECSSSSWVAYPPDCAHVEQHFDYAIDDNF